MDPIANMLTSLVNAQRAQKKRVALPFSGHKKDLLNLLQEEGYVAKVRVQEGLRSKLVVTLKYDDGEPGIRGVKRLSSPGRRVYTGRRKIPFTYSQYGVIVVSTSKGLMNERKARKEGIGGELICAIW